MLYNNTYDLDFNSLNNARSVVTWEWKYEAFRKNVFGALLYVVAVPSALLFGFYLSRKRKKFNKEIRQTKVCFHTSQEYDKLRCHLDEFKTYYPVLKKVKNYNMQKLPFVFRYSGVEMQKMTRTLLQYFEWLEKAALSLDKTDSKSKSFKLTSEKDLWQNKNKAYKYWM